MILYFLIYPQNALMASRRGLTLWFEQILPTLLPFSVVSYIILHSNLFSQSARTKNHNFLRIQPEEWYVIFCGFLFGFPIGSKLSADLYEHHRITRKRAQVRACFTNNLSPVFVTSVLVNQLHFSSVVPFFLVDFQDTGSGIVGIDIVFDVPAKCRGDKVAVIVIIIYIDEFFDENTIGRII